MHIVCARFGVDVWRACACFVSVRFLCLCMSTYLCSPCLLCMFLHAHDVCCCLFVPPSLLKVFLRSRRSSLPLSLSFWLALFSVCCFSSLLRLVLRSKHTRRGPFYNCCVGRGTGHWSGWRQCALVGFGCHGPPLSGAVWFHWETPLPVRCKRATS